jgi:hypothetical protein
METLADADEAYLLSRKPDATEDEIEAFIEITSKIWAEEGEQDDAESRRLAYIAMFEVSDAE